MKDLILVRHAKSSWKEHALRDHERPLNKRGKRDAPEMGKRLARCGYDPDLMVSSSAERALKTARTGSRESLHILAKSSLVEDRLYHAGVAELLHVIRGVDDSVDSMMLFGHNPGLTDIANHIGPREILNMPTCAVLHLRFEAESWAEVGKTPVDEVMYDYPKSNHRNEAMV